MWNVDIQLVAEKILRRLRRVGLRETLREGIWWLGILRRGRTTNDFDVKYGTDTGGNIPLWKFKVGSPNVRFGREYQTVDEQVLIDAITALREDPQALTFIDLGCGKGRALLVAANLGFQHVIGVEFVHQLAEIARKNLAHRGTANAVVAEGDAAKYRFPNCDMVVYLFNPFSQEVMQKVVANLRESHARKLYVIYVNPECAGLFDASGFLTRLGCPPGRADIQIWSAATLG